MYLLFDSLLVQVVHECTGRTVERAALPLGPVPIQIYKLLIFPLSSYFPSCTFITQLWWLSPVFSTLAHPSWWLSHYISIVYLTQINKVPLQKGPFSQVPVLPNGLWSRHWHGKHRFTPSCDEKWEESLEDQFPYSDTIKFCCLEMFWAIGNIFMGLSYLSQVLLETCAFPKGQVRMSWAMLGSSNGQRQTYRTNE